MGAFSFVVGREANERSEFISVEKYYAVTTRPMLSNPTIFSAYLAAVRIHGEAGARAYLASETDRLLRQRTELACNP